MKSMSRLAFMLIMAALLTMLPALKLNAQDAQCFGLSAGDCQLLQSAGAASSTAKLTSFVADYTLTLKVTGTGESDVDVKVTGTGPISFDPTKLQGDITSNPEAFFSAMTMSNTVSITATTGGQTTSNNVEVRIVDGKVYFKDDQTTKGKWMWQSLSGLSSDPSIGSTLGSATGGAGAATQMMSDPAVMAALAKLPYAAGFIVAQRSADETIGGEPSAHFVFNVNVLTLLQSPELKNAALALAKASGQPTEEIETQLTQVSAAAQSFLKDLKIAVHQYVGSNDKTLHGLGLDLSLKLDPATAGMLTGSTSTSTTPIDANFNFLVKFTNVGQPVTVEPVADAQEFKSGSQ